MDEYGWRAEKKLAKYYGLKDDVFKGTVGSKV